MSKKKKSKKHKKKSRLEELVEFSRLKERVERLEALADGRKQRSNKFKSKRDYSRKPKHRSKEDE